MKRWFNWLVVISICLSGAFAEPMDDLEMGCNYATMLYPNAMKKLAGEDKALLDNYLQFMETGKGAELIPAVLSGEAVEDENEAYLPMVKAFVYSLGKYGERLPFYERFAKYHAAFKDKMKDVETKGRVALIKGYLKQDLTDADRQALKDYAILFNITHTGAKMLPFHLGLSGSGVFKPGDAAPDFCLRTMEDALNSSTYSDVRVSDPVAFLKPEAVEELTRLFERYQPAANGRQVTHDLPEEKEGMLRLSSFRGKNPVLLILADPVDCYFPQVQAMLEPLKRACGDRIEFLFVHVSIHDTRMNPLEYFGPDTNNTMIISHEMFPGHYLQYKVATQSAPALRALFANGAYVEGWGSFVEELMLDAGWADNAPLTRLAHLRKRLENATRAYVSVQVNSAGWGETQVLAFARDEGLLAPQFATNLWQRVVNSPLQITDYFTGYREFRRLYAAFRARYPDAQTRLWVDQVLHAGPLPLALLEPALASRDTVQP